MAQTATEKAIAARERRSRTAWAKRQRDAEQAAEDAAEARAEAEEDAAEEADAEKAEKG